MLDATTGELVLATSGVRLGPALTPALFEHSALGARAARDQGPEPWVSFGLALPMGELGPFPAGVTLYFRGDALHEITLMNVSPEFGRGWDDWSREKELARRAAHDRWLAECGVPAGRYAWGRVASEYVDKSALSMIGLTYGAS